MSLASRIRNGLCVVVTLCLSCASTLWAQEGRIAFGGNVTSEWDPQGIFGGVVVGDALALSFVHSGPLEWQGSDFSSSAGAFAPYMSTATLAAGAFSGATQVWSVHGFNVAPEQYPGAKDGLRFFGYDFQHPNFGFLWQVALLRPSDYFPANVDLTDLATLIGPDEYSNMSITITAHPTVWQQGNWLIDMSTVSGRLDGDVKRHDFGDSLTPVPEPSTFTAAGALLLMGLVAYSKVCVRQRKGAAC